jgi:predicted phage terminase large subunit-like protein
LPAWPLNAKANKLTADVYFDGIGDVQADLIRASYRRFCEAALKPLGQAPARHHKVMIRALQGVGERKKRRVLIKMPPNSAKTTYSTIMFPPWLLAQPWVNHIITASANGDLANSFLAKSLDVANRMKDALGYDFAQCRSDYWKTSTGKELAAFGAGADTAGRRADAVLIDDPFGSWRDANSKAERDRIDDWYRGDIINRLNPGGAVILVMTHWNKDDQAGRLIERMNEGGEHWDVISMQAIYDGTEPDPLGRNIGEVLWPERFPLAEVLAKRAEIGEAMFAALHQQNPIPPGGLMFAIDKLQTIDALPPLFQPAPPGAFNPGPQPGAPKRRTVRYWDIAMTEAAGDARPDWTVGLKLTEINKKWIIEDVRRLQKSRAGVEKAILDTARADGRGVQIGLPQDPGAAGKFMSSTLVAMLAGFNVRADRELGKKAERALPVAAQVENGNIAMVKAPWNDVFRTELAVFPGGRNDDQVDALAGAFRILTGQTRGGGRVVTLD